MFNPSRLVIDGFVEHLRASYHHTYGLLEPEYPNIVAFIGRMALENIGNSDAGYHDVNHTILVTDVGQEMIQGKHICEGGVTPKDWLHFMVSLLCHDIGYVRGVCRGDRDGRYVIDADGGAIELVPGATDAALTPHHVTRAKLFVRERFAKVSHVDVAVIEANIEHTRFPVPQDESHRDTESYPGLVRASDLIGQLGDIDYMRKLPFLYHEFQETGTAQALGWKNSDELRQAYPGFFWNAVAPFIQDGLRYLSVTHEGKRWIATLYSHVFAQEHRAEVLSHRRG